MARNVFANRASALENAFFHRLDQELIIKIQEQHQLETDEDMLATATGIIDRKLLDELLAAEITPKTLVAFSLFPAVYVAWSDGHVEIAEREAILKAAHVQGITNRSPAHQLLESWLKTKPTEELVSVWQSFIHAMRPVISPTAFRDLQEAAMKRAHTIAEAAGGFLGFGSVSAAEKAAIEELDAVFADAVSAEQPAAK